MRVCLVGDWREPPDEGMRKTAQKIAQELDDRIGLLKLNPFQSWAITYWWQLIRFKPQVIHYIGGPSSFSFVLLGLMKMLTGAKTVLSAIHPQYLSIPLAHKLFKIDLVLVQSSRTAKLMEGIGKRLEWLPGGVDTQKYIPVDETRKQTLREKYKIPADGLIVLHVGNAKRRRNLTGLVEAATLPKVTVVIVTSSSLSKDAETIDLLSKADCILLTEYIASIEEVYALSDCYAFTVTSPDGAIDLPLSVLEAMSCNLPIVATRFGGLQDYFSEREGFLYVDGPEDLPMAIQRIAQTENKNNNRELAKEFDWHLIASKLEDFYAELIES